MTTIAWDGKTLASDSRCTSENLIVDNVQKVYRLTDGSLLAGSGMVEQMEQIRIWTEGGCRDDSRPALDQCTAFRITPDGKAWVTHARCLWRPINAPTAACGSGRELALAAMRCGKSAAEAVSIACEFDVFSGGEIQQMSVDSGFANSERVAH